MPRRYSILTLAVVLLVVPILANAQETLRDPTRPWSARSVAPVGSVTATGVTGFRVTAIFTSEKRRIAIVNGLRVSEGDRVNGATVVEILADDIRLDFNGKTITARVLRHGFRQR